MKCVAVYKGEIIPDRNGTSAYRIAQDIYVGDSVSAEQFEGITRPSPRPGDRMDDYTAQWLAGRIDRAMQERQRVEGEMARAPLCVSHPNGAAPHGGHGASDLRPAHTTDGNPAE